MASNELKNALVRVLAMQIESVASLATAGGVTYAPYAQPELPYWTNAFINTAIDVDAPGSEIFDLRVYTIRMNYIVAHITEGYDGEIEDTAQDVVPLVLDFFAGRPLLTSTIYPAPYPGIWDAIGARITSVGGLAFINNAGISTRQLSIPFTLSIPLLHEINYQ